jgi:hypothetical protein
LFAKCAANLFPNEVLAQLVERLNGINARLIFSLYPHLI